MKILNNIITQLRKYFELLFWMAAITVLFFLSENKSAASLCPSSLLGWDHCPGCGIGHAIHDALHLQLALSFEHHPLGIFAVIVIFIRIKQLIYTQKTVYETQSH